MLVNRNILCIANPSWEGDYAKAIVELMSVFAGSNRVLYADAAHTVTDVIRGLFGRKVPVRRILGLTERVRCFPVADGREVFVLTLPMLLPVNFLPAGPVYDLLQKWNGRRSARVIRRSLRKLKMEQDLVRLTAFNPALGNVTVPFIPGSVSVYYCYDQISAAAWMRKHGPAQEKRMMQQADFTVVTSQGLLETKRSQGGACFLVRNGVNYELFRQGYRPGGPAELHIGFTGSLDERVDFDLLDQVIGSMPRARFSFVGRIRKPAEMEKLRKYRNVTVHGPRPVAEIPAFLATFSVAVIPFLKNEFNRGIYPLKINEYLAAGIPVVATSFSNLDEFAGLIQIADTPMAFREALETSAAGDQPVLREQRTRFAEKNSWHSRADELSELILSAETSKTRH